MAPEPVSGHGSVFTYTVNHHAFDPTIPLPYIIAVIELDEQEDLRVVANIVDCQPDSMRIGMRVAVTDSTETPVFVPA